jgi:hypothetical protein
MDSAAGREWDQTAPRRGKMEGGGGGGGVRACPVGALEVSENTARFIPYVSPQRLISAFAALSEKRPGPFFFKVWGLDYPFTVPRPSGGRCCPSSLYTFPKHRLGLGSGLPLNRFPDFEQFCIAGFPNEHSSFV